MKFTERPFIEQLINLTLPTTAKKLAFSLPAHCIKPLSLLPSIVSEKIVAMSLNQVFKSALSEEELGFLVDNWLQLSITDINFCCYITVIENPSTPSHIKVLSFLPNDTPQPNVEFSADTHSLVLLAAKQVDPDTLFFQRKLLVIGETELGLAIKNFLDDFDIRENLPQPIKILANQLHTKVNTARD